MLKKKSNKLIAILLSVLLSGVIPAAVTLGDDLIGDADGILVVNNGGNVVDGSHNALFISPYKLTLGEKKSFYLSLGIVKDGSSSERVDFDIDVEGKATITKNPGSALLSPTSWKLGGYAINTSGNFRLDVTAPSTPGWYDYEVTFEATINAQKLTPPSTTATIRVEVVAPQTVPDTTKPTLSYTLNPANANGENGWYTSSVEVTFNYSDEFGGSGIDPLSEPVNYTLSKDAIYPSKEVTVKDKAGNEATVTIPEIKIDATAPTLTHSLTPEDPNGNNGWYTSPVEVTFTADDPTGGSGLNTGSIPADYSISVDDTHLETTYFVKDMAGNTGTTIVPEIKLDQTNPEISGAATTLPNQNNWYNDDVTIRYTFSDDTSGISDGTTTFDEILSEEGANQSSTLTVFDVAGNSATASVSEINIDKTKPEITFNMPVEGASYKLNEVIFADWTASDTLSGIDSTTPDMTGTPLETSTIGPKSLTVTATDKAGNTETVTVNYKVIYDFEGFFKPVEMGPGMLNSAKAGSSIPIKFSLNGDMGLSILPNGTPEVYTYNANSNTYATPIDTTATAGNSTLSYDPITDQYTYVWKTDKSWAGSGKQFVLTLTDGTTHCAYFKFK